MIPNHLALVPLHEGRRAALRAIGDIESRIAKGKWLPEFAWAKAFFKHLTGSKRITLREIRYFSPTLTDRELRGRKGQWIGAINALIESQGTCCYLPLCSSSVNHLFPEVRLKRDDRWHKHREMDDKKYSRQRSKEAARRHTTYQARVGQAEIDLAFHTPETVSSWSARWRQTEIQLRDLEDMFFRWSERFPTLATLDRGFWDNQPHWALMYEVQVLAQESSQNVRALERWMVPNKLNHHAQAAI